MSIGLGSVLSLLLRLLSDRDVRTSRRTNLLVLGALLFIAAVLCAQPQFHLLAIAPAWCLAFLASAVFFWPRLSWPWYGKKLLFSESLGALIILIIFFGFLQALHVYPEWPLSLVLAAIWARACTWLWDARWASKSREDHRLRMWSIALPAVFGAFLVFARIFFNPPPIVEVKLYFNIDFVRDWLQTAAPWLADLIVFAAVVAVILWLVYLDPDRVARHFSEWSSNPFASYSYAILLVAIALLYSWYRAQELITVISSMKASRLGCGGTFVHLFTMIVPGVIILATLISNVILAVVGRVLSIHKRERVTEISTKIYLVSVGWLCIYGLSIYFPLVVYISSVRIRYALFFIWIFGALSGFISNERLRRMPSVCVPFVRLLRAALPYIFLLGLLALCSWGVDVMVLHIKWNHDYFMYMNSIYAQLGKPIVVLTALIAILSSALATRFGINMSSMHVFYRGRLARAFLQEELPGGSSQRAGVKPQALRRLDELIPSKEDKKYNGPYLILNAAMNLGAVDELAWQERKAANFIFSPLYCGFHVDKKRSEADEGGANGDVEGAKSKRKHDHGYCLTADFGYGGEKSIRLAMAMAISGSALSSNMGRFSSSGRRFMNTVFNVRLGWWLNNPAYGAWGKTMSRNRLRMLLAELIGYTSDRGPFVNLSDGGHFDNSGIYELIRRRSKVVIAIDASEDASGAMSSLANAVERCRSDFGAEIDLDIGPLLECEGQEPKLGFVVGSIRYSPEQKGVIAVVKARLIGTSPVDVWSYGRMHHRFPNESTANQWFSESQFESYRELGFQVGATFAKAIREAPGDSLYKKMETFLPKEMSQAASA